MARFFGSGTGRCAMAVIFCGAVSLAVAHGPPGGGEALDIEPRFLPAAERDLENGNAGRAEEIYRRALFSAGAFEDRLALAGPWGRAGVVAQRLPAMLENHLPEVARSAEAWELPVIQATLFQYVTDLGRARTALEPALEGPMAARVREQVVVWSEEIADVEPALPHYVAAFEKNPNPENQLALLHALMEAGDHETFSQHLAGRGEQLLEEHDLWRSLLPELKEHGFLDTAGEPLEEVWGEADDRPEILFALGELRVFQGRIGDARGLFWRAFSAEETTAGDGFAHFQRLNNAFHNRFGVKHRLGQATDRYGTDMCRQFLFLGLREDVRAATAPLARDTALLYLRELEMPELSSAEFLEQVAERLDEAERPAVQRILAFAVLAAPPAVVREVRAFVDSAGTDNVAAEFALFALNRLVLSTAKFPDLQDEIISLARDLGGKFDATRPVHVRRRTAGMQNQVLSRLGAEAPGANEVAEEGSREEYFQRISEAVEAGDPAEGERLLRELQASGGDREGGAQGALLFLSRAWREQGNDRRAAQLAVAYVQHLSAGSPSGEEVAAPVEWRSPMGFPPPNPFLDPEELEALQGVLEILGGEGDAWRLFQEELDSRLKELLPDDRPGFCAAAMALLWWAEENEEAVQVAEECAGADGDANLLLLRAHLLAGVERYEEGVDVLHQIPAESAAAGAARRLEFAFAVEREDGAEAERLAEELRSEGLVAEERVGVARGLRDLGLPEAAGQWVEGLSFAELRRDDQEDFWQIKLNALMAQGDESGAAALARRVLLGELPGGYRELSSPARALALDVLHETGDAADYREGLEQLLEFVPRALAIRLLLGEFSEHRWREADQAEGLEETLRWYRGARDLRPENLELQLELAEWAAERELDEVAVEEFNRLLRVDAQSVLLSSTTVFETYRRAGRLGEIVAFLEEWQVPEADSLDDFYGLQPTEHLFRPLGEILLRDGNEGAAERAGRKGLEINPIAFTEEIRVQLAELHARRDRIEDLLEVIEGYVNEPEADPQLYAIQPFPTYAPRWILARNLIPEASRAPVERLLEVAEEAGATDRLLRASAEWREEHPERFSSAAFRVFLLARSGDENWRTEWEDLQQEFPADKGVAIARMDEARKLFETVGAE